MSVNDMLRYMEMMLRPLQAYFAFGDALTPSDVLQPRHSTWAMRLAWYNLVAQFTPIGRLLQAGFGHRDLLAADEPPAVELDLCASLATGEKNVLVRSRSTTDRHAADVIDRAIEQAGIRPHRGTEGNTYP